MRITALILALAALFVSETSAASDTSAGLLTVRNFTAVDGLASGAIQRIRLDSRGFLWICADGGLSRFDGHEFATYGREFGISGQGVNDIVERPDRSGYWVATTDGLYSFDITSATTTRPLFTAIPLPIDGAARVLLVDSSERLWVGLARGVVVLDPRSGDPARVVLPAMMPAFAGSRTHALIENLDHSIWIGTHNQGLFRVAGDFGSVRNYPASIKGASFIRDLAIGPDERLWCTYLGGVARFRQRPELSDDPIEERFEVEQGMPSIDTASLLTTPAGEILVSSRGGIARLVRADYKTWKVASVWTMRDGLPSEATTDLAFDPAGNLWIGTFARGAMRLVQNGFRRYPQIESDGAVLVGLSTDSPGRVLALADLSHRGYRLYSMGDGASSVTTLQLPVDIDYLGWGINRLAIDGNGSVWTGTGKALFQFQPRRGGVFASGTSRPVARFDRQSGLAGEEIFWVARDGEIGIWAGTTIIDAAKSSLAHIDLASRKVRSFPASINTRGPAFATALARDRSGASWIGFGNGAIVWFDQAGMSRTIEFEPPLPQQVINQLFFDSHDTLWIAGSSGRVFRTTQLTAEHSSLQEPFPAIANEVVNCATEDLSGRLYFGTDRGVVRVEPNSGASRLFTTEDGLSGTAITHCARESSGRLWFGDYHGLVSLVPSPDPPDQPAEATLSALSLDGSPASIPPLGSRVLGPLELAAGTHRIALRFFAINYAAGKRVRFQFDIDESGRWSEPSEARGLELAVASAGAHRISVRTVPELGVETAAAVLDLVIARPLWQRGWFVALVLLGVTLAIYSIYRLRLAQLLASERMRTRIATDLHDAVGADLSRISLMADAAERELQADPAVARTTLSDVAQSARDAVREMSDIVWALKPKRDDLTQVVHRLQDFAADVARPAGVSFTVDTQVDLERVRLDAESCRDLYLLLKEGIANVAKHAQAKSIALEIKPSGRGLAIELRDDGCGFDPQRPRPTHGGHGLDHMRQRAQRLGASLEISSRANGGTTIRLECMNMRLT